MLQVISWLGKLFIELSLTFGGCSSPGIYDRISECILRISCLLAKIRRSRVIKQLDDNVMIGSWREVRDFYVTYKEVCSQLGVKLAPEEEGSDKCFAVTSKGTILGLDYDLHSWTWGFSDKKCYKMLEPCFEIVNENKVTIGLLKTLVGRIGFYMVVFGEEAIWERGFLLHASNQSDNLKAKVSCSANLKSQARFWIRNLLVFKDRSEIPSPCSWEPSVVSEFWTDAAGGGRDGSPVTIKNGIGGVFFLNGKTFWFCLPHSDLIRNGNATALGDIPGGKLSFLEGAAMLAGLCCFGKFLKNSYVKIYCDNAGCVWASRNRHSRDLLTYTVMKALFAVARGLNIRLVVVKTPRCSGRGELIADHLSKTNIPEAAALIGYHHELLDVPRTLIKYLQHPTPTRCLGQAILRELMQGTEILDMQPELSYELEQFSFKRKR